MSGMCCRSFCFQHFLSFLSHLRTPPSGKAWEMGLGRWGRTGEVFCNFFECQLANFWRTLFLCLAARDSLNGGSTLLQKSLLCRSRSDAGMINRTDLCARSCTCGLIYFLLISALRTHIFHSKICSWFCWECSWSCFEWNFPPSPPSTFEPLLPHLPRGLIASRSCVLSECFSL